MGNKKIYLHALELWHWCHGVSYGWSSNFGRYYLKCLYGKCAHSTSFSECSSAIVRIQSRNTASEFPVIRIEDQTTAVLKANKPCMHIIQRDELVYNPKANFLAELYHWGQDGAQENAIPLHHMNFGQIGNFVRSTTCMGTSFAKDQVQFGLFHLISLRRLVNEPDQTKIPSNTLPSQCCQRVPICWGQGHQNILLVSMHDGIMTNEPDMTVQMNSQRCKRSKLFHR